MGGAEYELSRQVVRLAGTLGMTVGAAESCTGGMVCAAITDVPGSSSVLRGGIVSYDPAVKRSVLGVSDEICNRLELGVVSEVCARQMASEVRSVVACDVAVSTTGIAGPGGAEAGKPVGTVWFGVATAKGAHAVRRLLPGDRAQVRRAAVRVALELLVREIQSLGVPD